MDFKESMLSYLHAGWKPLPATAYFYTDKKGVKKRHKQPIVKWEEYENKFPTEIEIEEWSKKPWADKCGIAIVTGGGIVVVDFDQTEGNPDVADYAEFFLSTMWTRTASGGIHMFFRTDEEVRNATNIFGADKNKGETVVDIRGDGGIVIVGPSILWSDDPRTNVGATQMGLYETKEIWNPTNLAPLPDIFKTRAKELPKKYVKAAETVVTGNGDRHDVSMSLIAKLVGLCKTPAEFDTAKEAYRRIIQEKFQDPLPDEEVERIFKWAIEQERKRKGDTWYIFSDAVREARQATKEERDYAEDMEKWKAVAVAKLERINSTLRFVLVSGTAFNMDVADFYNQARFRTCFTAGTSTVLPPIRKKSFDAFLLTLKMEQIEDTSATIEEIIDESLMGVSERLAEAETEDKALEVAGKGRYSKYRGTLYFKMATIHNTLRQAMGNTTQAKISIAMRTMNVERVHSETGNVWKYPLN